MNPANPRQHDAPDRAADRLDRGDAPRLRLTAMLDVCFLLLIFFVLTAQFAVSEGILPHESSYGPGVEAPPVPIRIDLHSVGPDDVSIQLVGMNQAVGSAGDLYRLIDGMRVTPRRPGAPLSADDPIVIHPDATVAWGQVLNVYNAVARARYENINFAAAGR